MDRKAPALSVHLPRSSLASATTLLVRAALATPTFSFSERARQPPSSEPLHLSFSSTWNELSHVTTGLLHHQFRLLPPEMSHPVSLLLKSPFLKSITFSFSSITLFLALHIFSLAFITMFDIFSVIPLLKGFFYFYSFVNH